MSAVLKTIEESFARIRCAELAAQVPNRITVCQWKMLQKCVQLFESVADFQRIRFMGYCVGLVHLVQDGFTIAVTEIWWV